MRSQSVSTSVRTAAAAQRGLCAQTRAHMRATAMLKCEQNIYAQKQSADRIVCYSAFVFLLVYFLPNLQQCLSGTQFAMLLADEEI